MCSQGPPPPPTPDGEDERCMRTKHTVFASGLWGGKHSPSVKHLHLTDRSLINTQHHLTEDFSPGPPAWGRTYPPTCLSFHPSTRPSNQLPTYLAIHQFVCVRMYVCRYVCVCIYVPICSPYPLVYLLTYPTYLPTLLYIYLPTPCIYLASRPIYLCIYLPTYLYT